MQKFAAFLNSSLPLTASPTAPDDELELLLELLEELLLDEELLLEEELDDELLDEELDEELLEDELLLELLLLVSAVLSPPQAANKPTRIRTTNLCILRPR